MRLQQELSEKDLCRIGELIYQRAGIVVNKQKHGMVYNRLSRRLRELKIESFGRYIQLLESNPNSPEWQCFINALTTNLTSFFREAYHFPILAEHARSRPVNYSVWCAAASTGEEPCSIAITLNDALGPALAGPRVWATDIDTDVLAKARSGIYRLSDIAGLSQRQKQTYFMRGTGEQRERVRVKRELLSSIHYQQLNLLNSEWDIPAPFDAIFCRNVMIYFDKNTQQRLLKRFAKLLKPNGILFAGHLNILGTLTALFNCAVSRCIT